METNTFQHKVIMVVLFASFSSCFQCISKHSVTENVYFYVQIHVQCHNVHSTAGLSHYWLFVAYAYLRMDCEGNFSFRFFFLYIFYSVLYFCYEIILLYYFANILNIFNNLYFIKDEMQTAGAFMGISKKVAQDNLMQRYFCCFLFVFIFVFHFLQ